MNFNLFALVTLSLYTIAEAFFSSRPNSIIAPTALRYINTNRNTVARIDSNTRIDAKIEEEIGYQKSGVIEFPDNISTEWELDCYSRPVVGDDKKKLWEILITDSNGSFRYLKVLPSNLVNSRNLRKIVEEVIEESPVKPTKIRFFRNQMFNMISIALNPLDVEVKPSRCTSNLFMWLQEREENIYPRMSGYNPQLRQQTILDYDVSQPDKLPDVLKAESYAFVRLPVEVFLQGQVSKDTVDKGKFCSVRDMPKEGWVYGIALISKRSKSVAAWMNGVEVASLKADLLGRELLMNVDINTQYIVAPLSDAQKNEAQAFEKGKAELKGYHFLSVQGDIEGDDVDGFWLLREFDSKL